jgi:hypothetical protein
MLEISNVEHRDNELYVRVMADAIDGTKTAGLAERAFVGGSLNA